MIKEGFLSDWEAQQQEEIDNEIIPALQQLESFAAKCDAIEQQLAATKPQQLCFDKERMNELGLLRTSEHFHPQIDYDQMFAWFIGAMPELLNALYFKPPWSLMELKRESQLLDQLLSRTHTLMDQIDMITVEIPLDFGTQSTEVALSTKVKSWHESLMVTPTMKCPVKKDFYIKIWDVMPNLDSPVRIMPPNITCSTNDTSGKLTFCAVKIKSMK